MEKPLIGILLPVYKNDSPDYFRMSLASMLEQTYTNIKVLIGVDGPIAEKLDEVICEAEQKDKVVIIRFAENRGLACVLNDLIDRCREHGIEYLARMDADDISVKDRLERQYQYLVEHKDVDVVGGKIEEINEKSEKNGKSVEYPLSHEECRKFFRYRDPMAHPATFFRMRYFDKCGGYRNEYRKNQDTMLWFDGFRCGCVFANLSETVLNFRVSEDFYKSRRGGWQRAKKMLKDRFMINSTLHYDLTAYFFSFAMFCMTMAPAGIRRWLYARR